jgi:hypothetical protein
MIITGFVLIDKPWNAGLAPWMTHGSPHDPASVAVHLRGARLERKERPMFSVHCEQCGSVLLLGPANIIGVQNTSEGIAVHFRCHAGHRGVWLPSGRSDRPAIPSTAREHASHLATAAGTGGRADALLRRPSDARPPWSAPGASGFESVPSGRPASGTGSAANARRAPGTGGSAARPLWSRRQVRHRVVGLGAIANRIGTRPAGRPSWTAPSWRLRPWRRGNQSCGDSGRR